MTGCPPNPAKTPWGTWLFGCLLLSGSGAVAGGEDVPEPALLEFLGQWNGEEMTWLDEALREEQDRKQPRPTEEVKDDE